MENTLAVVRGYEWGRGVGIVTKGS